MGLMNMVGRIIGRSRTIIGLDLGNDSVKVIELARTSSGLELVRYGITKVREEKGQIGGEAGPEVMLEAIQRAFAESGIPMGAVCTAVSGESVIVRPIPMPRFETKREEEFEMAVRSEAGEYIPFEMDDVILDYQRLGTKPGREGTSRAAEVLIVAVKKDLIDRHLGLVEAVGLDPVIIDVDSIALVNAVISGSDINPDEAIAVVNIGSNVTNIAIMRNQMTRFTRDLSFAGKTITNSIAAQFDVSVEDAENLKYRWGLSSLNAGKGESESREATSDAPGVIQDLYEAIEDLKQESDQAGGKSSNAAEEEHQVSELCEQIISDIVSEVKRSLLYYENQLDGEPISRILLSGGTAKLRGIQQYFESVLDVPTDRVQPFQKIKTPFDEKEAEEKGPLLGVCLGLALRNVI